MAKFATKKITAVDKKALEAYLEKLKLIEESGHVNYAESAAEKESRIKRASKNFNFYVRYYFPHYAETDCAPFHIDAANAVLDDEFFRGIMEWARGLAKSTTFDVFLPIWLYKFHHEMFCMLLVGETEGKAKILLGDLQAEFEANPQLKHDFGNLVQQGDWKDGNFITVDNVAFFAMGKGGNPRGIKNGPNRPDYIVCDDLDDDQECRNPSMVKKRVQWILRALIPAVSRKKNRIVIVNNRISNISILATLAQNKKFKHFKVNACDENLNPVWEAYTKAFYKLQYDTLGPVVFNSEYRNDPLTEGEIFTDALFAFKPRLRYREYERIVGYWDIAYSNSKTADYNAIPVVGLKGNEKHVLKGFLKQCVMEDALRWLYKYNESLPENILIEWYAESQFWNTAVELALKTVAKEFGYRIPIIFADRPGRGSDKYSRMIQMLPAFHRSEVYFAEQEKHSPDIQLGIEQTKGIEPGYRGHDDFPDALSAAIDKLDQTIQYADSTPQLGMRPKPTNVY